MQSNVSKFFALTLSRFIYPEGIVPKIEKGEMKRPNIIFVSFCRGMLTSLNIAAAFQVTPFKTGRICTAWNSTESLNKIL